jgi:hypothetical protein
VRTSVALLTHILTCRFLKKDPTSRLWEDVGDEVAREKASQVLRDAVALIHPEDSQAPQPQRDSIFAVPSLDETATSSTDDVHVRQADYYPPHPTLVQHRNKRARIAQSFEESIANRPVPMHANVGGLPSSVGGNYPRAIIRPPALLSVDLRNSSTATAASLLGDLHADVHPEALSEFDLFNGGLLDGGDPSNAAAGARSMS